MIVDIGGIGPFNLFTNLNKEFKLDRICPQTMGDISIDRAALP
jgi:hypothetical protein